jgi:hypothetical protein
VYLLRSTHNRWLGKAKGRTMVECHILRVAMLSFVILACATSETCRADEPVDRVQVLQRLARTTRANYERIQSWQGSYTFHDRFYHEANTLPKDVQLSEEAKLQPVLGKDNGRIRFAVDTKSNSIYTTTEPAHPQLYEEIQTGRILGKSGGTGGSQFSVITPEMYLAFEPLRTSYRTLDAHPVRPTGRMAIQQHPSAAELLIGITNLVVDPRETFSIDGAKFWDRCDFYARSLLGVSAEEGLSPKLMRAAENSLFVTRIEDDGRKVFQVIYQPPVGNHLEELRFDERVGYNPVTYRSNGPVIKKHGRSGLIGKEYRWNYRYDAEADVYVPSEIRLTLFHGEVVTFERILFLEESLLNRPLDKSTFTFEVLGLETGDRLWDKQRDLCFVHVDGVLQEAGCRDKPERESQD